MKKNLILTIQSVNKNLHVYSAFMERTLNTLKIMHSSISLPTKRLKMSLLKSPHVNKKAIEQFQILFFKRVYYLPMHSINLLRIININKPKFIKVCLKIS